MFVAVMFVAVALTGCGDDRQVIHVRLVGEGDGAQLPVLDPPMAAAEIEALAAGFDWATTTVLPETDEDGNPALYYATVLLRDRENLDELHSLDLVCDALPLFESELSRWHGQRGIFEFPGSAAGDVAFCVLPAEIYNLFRQLALDGSPLFDALLLRDLPEADAALPGGSISYAWAAAQGFRYGTSVNEVVTMTPTDGGVGAGTGMLFGRIRRSVRRVVRGVVNGVRRGMSAARQGLGGSHEFSLRLFVHNTDAAFGTSDLLRQHWGSHGGEPVWVDGLPVQVASGVMVSLDEAKTDDQGFMSMRIPRARRIRVFLRMQNRAADMIGLVWEKRILVFHGRVNRDGRVHINANIQSGVMNILAQLTDGRHFTRDVLHYHSPRRLRARLPARSRAMPAALVRTGVVAGLFPNAITPCLGSFGFGTLSLGRGRGYSVLANVTSLFDEADMYFPDDQARTSRSVATHEYGHFVMCRMLADEGGRAFGRAWGEVIGDSLAQDGPRNGQAGILGEAWADFFASQIAGGTDYFGLIGGSWTPSGQNYCDVSLVPSGSPCMDDNVGAPHGSSTPFPRGQFTPDSFIGNGRTVAIARWATILTDAADGALGPGDTFNNGVSWRVSGAVGRGGPGGPLSYAYQFGQSAGDEEVQLPGEGLADILGDWAFTSRHLHFAPFANSMARVMLLHGATEMQVCDLFALHASRQLCSELIDTEHLADGIVTSSPRGLMVTSRLATRAGTPEATLTWTDVSPLATDFETHCQGPAHDLMHTVAYARSQTDRFTALPFDAPLLFSVATRIDARAGAAASINMQSPAEPVGTLSAEALAGGARLSWAPVVASGYVVRQLEPSAAELTEVTSPMTELRGLAGDADYRFEVVSVNAAGERSVFPSSAILVHTLPAPVLYVSATLGDDAAAFGGTPSSPFASLGRALSAAPAGMRTTIRMAAGDYPESSLTIANLDLVIEGGYAEDPVAWRAGTGATTLRPALATVPVPPFSSPRFDATAGDPSRSLRAAMFIEAGSHVVLRDLALRTSEDPGSECRAVLVVHDADVTLERAHLGGEGPSACSLGVQATTREAGHRVELRDSELFGLDSVAPFPAAQIAAALTTAGFDQVQIMDSTLVALRATGASLALSQAKGWVDEGSTSLRASRSTFAAVRLGGGGVSAGLTAGVDARVTQALFFDNVVADAPGGADEADGLRVEGIGPAGIRVQLVHLTARVGMNFAPALAPSPRGSRSAVVSLSGRVRRMQLLNNLFAFADWGSYRDYGAVLDLTGLLSGSEAVPQVGSEMSHNVFSYPPASAFNEAGGALVMCDWQGEFSTFAADETSLNDSVNLLCHSTGFVTDSNNIALVRDPGDGPAGRYAVTLDESGQVQTTGADATGAGTVALLRSAGAALVAPWPVADIARDRAGLPRDASMPGIGAFIIP